jgi:hypothetical protein
MDVNDPGGEVERVTYRGMVCGLDVGDRVIASIDPAVPALIVDISRCDFIDPRGMLSLATACLDARAYGRDVQIVPPTNPDVSTYLLRIGFPRTACRLRRGIRGIVRHTGRRQDAAS